MFKWKQTEEPVIQDERSRPGDEIAQYHFELCKDWTPEVGRPAWIVSVQQWGVVTAIIDGVNVQLRLSNGKIMSVLVDDLLCTDVTLPKTTVITDGEGNPVTIGCGTINGEKMFWIDAKYETVTIVLANRDELIAAITEVTQ